MELLDKKQFAVKEYIPFYAQLEELEKENELVIFDYESKKGNKEARSHVHALRKSNAALDRTRKEVKDESLKFGRAIDAEAKEISVRIDAMIKVHQVKLDEIEKREADRINKHKEKLSALALIHHGSDIDSLKFHLTTLEAVVIDDKWQEFIAQAAQAKDASISAHRELLAQKEKAHVEALELERLRQEAAARAQKDRDDAIAKAAEERAQLEAKKLADKKELEARQAIANAEEKAKKDREASELRELELKLAAETAERRRIEGEQKAISDAAEALQLAEKKRLQAIQDEKERVAAIAHKDEQERRAREADKSHQREINHAALVAFMAGGLTEECAKLAITLIATKKIPAIQINY